jgi:predicted NBD/HSP70 family sugar kinase
VTGLTPREVALLGVVHGQPGLTRAQAARSLGFGTGAATELVAKLTAAGLLAETPAALSGARGRPTTKLLPHPEGPLVLAAAITQETWQVEAVQLGGSVLATIEGRHSAQAAPQVLATVAEAVRRLRRRLPGRAHGLGISVPGTLQGGQILDAAGLGWQGVDLSAVWPRAELFAAGNDATLAALAESRRGAASRAALALHVRIEAGLGGGIINDGRVLGGATGAAGEFGHLPFGDPAVACPCGAHGCWGTAVDGGALARLMGDAAPRDPVTYARRILARASAAHPAELRAVRTVAHALGRGIAGLVNAFDPDLITLGGLASAMLTIAADDLGAAYRAGLMDFRRSAPPPVIPALLGEAGPLTGAAEIVWTRLWPQLQT